METINILELFEMCVNGKSKCSLCPYHRKPSEGYSFCITKLGKDVINYIYTLKDQIEYYEEVIEEYETAELERQEHTIKLTDTPSSWIHESSTWTMTLDDSTAITGTGSIPAEKLAATPSSPYTSTRASSTYSIGYDPSIVTTSSSSKWELESAVEAIEAELKKKAKKLR